VLRDGVLRVRERVISAVCAEIPEYRRPLTGEFGRVVCDGLDEALHRFVDLVERPEHDAPGPTRALYYDLGRGECRQGRSLDSLLRAYRVAALIAWREIVSACEAAAVEPSKLYELAAALFAYIHELSAISAEGYCSERAAVQAARQELVELLTVRPADAHALQAAADRARYTLPPRIAMLASRVKEPDQLAVRTGPDAIGAWIAGMACVLVPEPERPGRVRRLARSLRGAAAALGPAVCPSEAAHTWQWARRALELTESGVIRESGMVRVEAHLGTILIHENQHLAGTLATRSLAPLEAQSDRYRRELPETLFAWLAHHGDVCRAAEELDVHPQTVRYRMNKLRELYGSALDDADARFELELALRATGVGLTRAVTQIHGNGAPSPRLAG
jgi:hypothetical protein